MYRCPACGRIISEEQYIADRDGGSGGNCYCESTDGGLILTAMVEAKWWELLNWNRMQNTWDRLSEEIKNEIREAGIAPSYDGSQSSTGSASEMKNNE